MHCNICRAEAPHEVESAEVRSNVRQFSSESFAIWRCPHCKSIHARDEVNLSHYYADYPFHKLGSRGIDWTLAAMYRSLLSRLKAAGVTRDSSVLDYGCGSGIFLSFLGQRGYVNLAGYDEFSESYADPAVLEKTYDCVFTQDLIEHVPEPQELVATLHRLVRPGGVVVVGTPNAEAIDLSDTEERVHTLHQPFHRHILSKTALQELGQDLGWELMRYYPTMYANTPVPFVNSAFINYYFKCFDNNVDLAVEPVKPHLKLLSPVALVHAFLGSMYAPECDVMAVYRRA